MCSLLAVFFISLIVCYGKACLKINGTATSAEGSLQEIELTKYSPPTLKSLIVHPESSDNYFDFVLDSGEVSFESEAQFKPQAKELIDYFFLGITLPSEDLWVNLNSVRQTEITSPRLALTDIGKVLLEADLRLKKDCCRFTDPRTKTGKEYWSKLQQRLNEEGLNTTQLPIGNRFWIIPLEAVVEEDKDNHTATIVKSKLKVCLQQEYLQLQNNHISLLTAQTGKQRLAQDIADFTMKETILPAIEHEVNYGKAYAKLRQVYNALILAEYYKQKYQHGEGLYPKLINRAHIQGLESIEPWNSEDFYNAYVKSAQEGEYKLTQQEYDPYLVSMVKKYYFYGGITFVQSIASKLKAIPKKASYMGNVLVKFFCDKVNPLIGYLRCLALKHDSPREAIFALAQETDRSPKEVEAHFREIARTGFARMRRVKRKEDKNEELVQSLMDKAFDELLQLWMKEHIDVAYPSFGRDLQIIPILDQTIDSMEGKRVLVEACGLGAYAFATALNYNCKVSAMDIDPIQIACARKAIPYLDNEEVQRRLKSYSPYVDLSILQRLEKQGYTATQKAVDVDFKVADARKLPYKDNSFDVVVIPFLLGIKNGIVDKDEMEAVIREAIRVTMPGGKILISPLSIYPEANLVAQQKREAVNIPDVHYSIRELQEQEIVFGKTFLIEEDRGERGIERLGATVLDVIEASETIRQIILAKDREAKARHIKAVTKWTQEQGVVSEQKILRKYRSLHGQAGFARISRNEDDSEGNALPDEKNKVAIPILSSWKQAENIIRNAPVVNYKEVVTSEDSDDLAIYTGSFRDPKSAFEEILNTKIIKTDKQNIGFEWKPLSSAVFYATRGWEWSPLRIDIIFELSHEKARRLYGINFHGSRPKKDVQLYDVNRAWLVRLKDKDDYNQEKAQMVEVAIPGMRKVTDIILQGDYPITRKAEAVRLALELEINRTAWLFTTTMKDSIQPYPYSKERIVPEYILSSLEKTHKIAYSVESDSQIDKDLAKQRYIHLDFKSSISNLRKLFARIAHDGRIKKERRTLLLSDSSPIAQSIQALQSLHEVFRKFTSEQIRKTILAKHPDALDKHIELAIERVENKGLVAEWEILVEFQNVRKQGGFVELPISSKDEKDGKGGIDFREIPPEVQ